MMARIKVGAYRFNDVLTVPQVLISAVIPFEVPPFTGEWTQELSDRLLAEDGTYIPVGTYTVTYSYSGMAWYLPDEYNPENIPFLDYRDQIAKVVPYNANGESVLSGTATEFYSVNRGWTSDVGEDNQTVIVTEDSDVSEEFYDWFIGNVTQVTAIITYDSCTIATVPSGRTATLKCQGKVMQSDVVVQVPMPSASEGGDTQAAYDQGYAEGVASVDNYLLYSQSARFGNLNLFGKSEVVINMPYVTTTALMFRPDTATFGSSACLNRTVEHITVNSESEKMTNATQMFYFAEPWDGQTALKHITLNMDMSKVTSVQYMFNGCSLLETIDGTPLDFSSVVDSTAIIMNAAPKVAYIRFAPNTIKVNLNVSGSGALTNESIRSIIGGLASTASGKTLTLSKTAVNNAFGSAESAEWLALVATKPNWTISLT